jgi:hypothetical protein
MNEAVEEVIAIGMGCEQAMGDAALFLSADGFRDAPVEALDHAVGARSKGLGKAVLDTGLGAHFVEWVVSGGFAFRLALHVDSEAVGELGTVIREDSVNPSWKMCQDTAQESGRGLAVAARVALQIDLAGCPVDGDEGS